MLLRRKWLMTPSLSLSSESVVQILFFFFFASYRLWCRAAEAEPSLSLSSSKPNLLLNSFFDFFYSNFKSFFLSDRHSDILNWISPLTFCDLAPTLCQCGRKWCVFERRTNHSYISLGPNGIFFKMHGYMLSVSILALKIATTISGGRSYCGL